MRAALEGEGAIGEDFGAAGVLGRGLEAVVREDVRVRKLNLPLVMEEFLLKLCAGCCVGATMPKGESTRGFAWVLRLRISSS